MIQIIDYVSYIKNKNNLIIIILFIIINFISEIIYKTNY